MFALAVFIHSEHYIHSLFPFLLDIIPQIVIVNTIQLPNFATAHFSLDCMNCSCDV